MSAKIYTCFFQYRDLTHVHQFKSSDVESAFVEWAKEIIASVKDDANATFKSTISSEVEERLNNQGLTLRKNLINVWCCTFVFDDDAFGDLNITITEN